MKISLNADQAAHFAADHYINFTQPGITQERKREILPIEKFNMIARGFSLATVLLVVGAVSLFFSLKAAIVFSVAGLVLRQVTGAERNKYLLAGGLVPPRDLGARLQGVFSSAFGLMTRDEKDRNLIDNLDIKEWEKWRESQWFLDLCGTDWWQSTVPISHVHLIGAHA